MIWLFASFVLVAFGYPLMMMALSYLVIYALYVVVSLANFASAYWLLRSHPDDQRYYRKLWWVAFTLPGYNFVCSWIRLVGIINGMTTQAAWQLKRLDQERGQIGRVLRADLQALRNRHKGE